MAFKDGNWRDNAKYMERAQYYAPMVQKALQQYGISDPQAADVIQGILGVESRWGLSGNLSKPGAAGELGIAQQTPAYRTQYGITDPLDEQQAINGVAAYVSQARAKGADWDLIPVGYNAGDGRLNQLISGKRSLEQMPQITQNYVARMREFMGGPSRAGAATQLGQYTPAVTQTMSKFGLSNRKPVSPFVSFTGEDFGLGSSEGLGPLLGQSAPTGLSQQPSTTQSASLWDTPARSAETSPVPLAGLFTGSPASHESINRLLQGIGQ